MLNSVVVATCDLKISMVNQTICKLLSYNSEDLIGQPLEKIFPKEQLQFSGKLIPNLNSVAYFSDGRSIPVTLSVSHQLNAKKEIQNIIIVVQETGEEDQAETILSDQQAILENLATNCPLSETLNLITSKIEEINPYIKAAILILDKKSMTLLTGSAPSLDRKYNEVLNGTPVASYFGSCCVAIDKNELVVAEDIATDPVWKKGKEVALSFGLQACWSNPIYSSEGGMLGSFALYSDLPASPSQKDLNLLKIFSHLASLAIWKKKAEKSLQAYNHELEQSNEELKKFLYIASHDLIEPLRKVVVFGDRLLESCSENLKEGEVGYVQNMQKAAFRMRDLVESLSNYSKLSHTGYKFEPLNLNEIAKEVIDDLGIQVESTKAIIQIDTLPEIEADKMYMRILFQNLISNGLKFRHPDIPPEIRIKNDSLEDGICKISVEDNGIGIKEEYLGKVFEPLKRLHTNSEFPGNGMGLFICRKIVTGHNGAISVKGGTHKGTTFIISIPEKHPESSTAVLKG